MNIILFAENELVNDSVVLSDHRAKHIVKILQSKTGDSLRVGMLEGNIGEARVVSIRRKYPFVVELSVCLTGKPDPPPAIDLLLAMPRPIMLKRILSQVTALGIDTIHLVNANRVEKSFWDTGLLAEEEYLPHLIHGLEQAVDTRLPKIQVHRHFRPFAEDTLPEMAAHYGGLLLAHPSAEQKLSQCLHETPEKILFAVGPEGGWVDFEVEKLLTAGMCSFSMGTRILKVDTAVVAIHSRISQVMERE